MNQTADAAPSGTPGAMSMTAIASRTGAAEGYGWAWEMRSVNARGLDLRLRVPDWIEGLEAELRKRLSARLSRGNVTLGLRIAPEQGDSGLALNPDALARVLTSLREVTAQAEAAGLPVAPVSPAEILGLRGVLESDAAPSDTGPLRAALLVDFEGLLDDFVAMRAAEGRALAGVLDAQVSEIAALADAARALVESRREATEQAFRAALERVRVQAAEGMDEARVAQELALLAVKGDIAEELDRLDAHVGAARALLAEAGPKGRKLDFLTQEFNREANTLCSKAGHAPLTAIGLELKAVIDRLREQVQNVE